MSGNKLNSLHWQLKLGLNSYNQLCNCVKDDGITSNNDFQLRLVPIRSSLHDYAHSRG